MGQARRVPTRRTASQAVTSLSYLKRDMATHPGIGTEALGRLWLAVTQPLTRKVRPTRLFGLRFLLSAHVVA